MIWFKKLKQGLSKSSDKINSGISSIFSRKKLDAVALEELEELLIMADIGVVTTGKIIKNISKEKFEKEVNEEEIKQTIAKNITEILFPIAKTIEITKKPQVILIVGVNGNGKTTTIGKTANILKNNKYSVMLAAADTFRAAATEQLQIWGKQINVPVITSEQGADSASVAYKALERAKSENIDVLLIDTAGRLHNNKNLMQELEKISRVLKKIDNTAPHNIVQIIDGTTGQNAISQVESFKEIIKISGLAVTKLDGTAKGGVVVALAEKFNLPIHFIGVGEGINDLQEFKAEDFAKNLVGI